MRCQGRPEDGRCPDSRNDSTVHNTIGDLFLCDACEEYRWPTIGTTAKTTNSGTTTSRKHSSRPNAKSATEKGKSRKVSIKDSNETATADMNITATAASVITANVSLTPSAGGQMVSCPVTLQDDAASGMSHISITEAVACNNTSVPADIRDVNCNLSLAQDDATVPGMLLMSNDEAAVSGDLLSADVAGVVVQEVTPSVLCNELLMYVNCSRDRAEVGNMKKVLASFYSSNEISEAKKLLLTVSVDVVNLEFATERRSSTQRPASEAEIDDIVGLFDFLDCSGHLDNVKFAACNYDRLPKYGPEDLNECAIADKQSRTEAAITALSTRVEQLASNQPTATTTTISDTTHIVDVFDKKIRESTLMIQDQICQLAAVCSQIKLSSSMNGGTTLTDVQKHPIDRTRNVVITGIAEDRTDSVWRSKVADVLCAAAGHTIQICDAFRMGKFDAQRVRPILVKLQSAWDRRIILSGAHNLSRDARFVRVFLSPDEPIEVRRQSQLERMKKRALRDGKCVVVNDGALVIDGVTVFSVKHGFVRRSATAEGCNVSSPVIDG